MVPVATIDRRGGRGRWKRWRGSQRGRRRKNKATRNNESDRTSNTTSIEKKKANEPLLSLSSSFSLAPPSSLLSKWRPPQSRRADLQTGRWPEAVAPEKPGQQQEEAEPFGAIVVVASDLGERPPRSALRARARARRRRLARPRRRRPPILVRDCAIYRRARGRGRGRGLAAQGAGVAGGVKGVFH